jgi:hypothetical protein
MRLGFEQVMISGAYEGIHVGGREKAQLIQVNRVEEAVKKLFGKD